MHQSVSPLDTFAYLGHNSMSSVSCESEKQLCQSLLSSVYFWSLSWEEWTDSLVLVPRVLIIQQSIPTLETSHSHEKGRVLGEIDGEKYVLSLGHGSNAVLILSSVFGQRDYQLLLQSRGEKIDVQSDRCECGSSQEKRTVHFYNLHSSYLPS